MHKSSLKKSIAILLSLLMVLSVFGGLTLTAGAEDTTEGHDIILTSAWVDPWYEIICTPGTTDIPVGQQVTITIKKNFPCVSFIEHRSLRAADGSNYTLTRTSDGYYAEFEMPDADVSLTLSGYSITHTGGDLESPASYSFADGDPNYPYTVVDSQTATGYRTRLCVYCGETSEWWGDATAYSIQPAQVDGTITLDFYHFAETDTARQRPFPASQYAIPGQLVYFKMSSDVLCAVKDSVRVIALNETDPQDEIACAYENGYFCFAMPEYPVQICPVYKHTPGGIEYYKNTGYYSQDVYMAEAVRYCTVCGKEASREPLQSVSILSKASQGVSAHVNFLNVKSDGLNVALPGTTVIVKVEQEQGCAVVEGLYVEFKHPYGGESATPEDCYVTDLGNGMYSFVVPRYHCYVVVYGHDEHDFYEINRTNVTATCSEPGTADIEYKCRYCNYHPTRYGVEIPALGHTEGAPVAENTVGATCTAIGTYDEVTYCETCGEELRREAKTLDRLDHTPGEAVVENYVEPTPEKEGSLSLVVYCANCKEELSRETVSVPKLTPAGDDPSDPSPTGGDLCKYCGKDHSGSFFQRIVGFFHSILYFFSRLFGRI